MPRKPKDGSMIYPLEVEKILWRKFLSTCMLQGKNGAQVLRKLIEAFVNENKNQ